LKNLKTYRVELLLLSLQFTPLAAVSTVLASLYIFYKVAYLPKIDILSLFLLLIPSIVFRQNDFIFELSQNQFGETGWFQFFIPTVKSNVIIGPLAVSAKLFAALAVPVRLLRFINKQPNLILMTGWFVALFISIFGLYLAIQQGIFSAGGITVGLRIVLSLGVLLFPVAIEPIELKYQLSRIMKLSIVLFLLGLMNAHWVFVSIAFPAIILFSKERIFWKILSVLMIAIVLLSNSSFTSIIIPLLAMLLIWFYSVKQRYSKQYNAFKIKSTPLLLYLFFPIYIVFLTVSQKLMTFAQIIGSDRFLSKLFDDRGSIWIFTIALIQKSNFFIVPAGRDILTLDYGKKGYSEWGAGAHNIFLEIVRQDGLLVFIILFIILSSVFWKLHSHFEFNNNISKNILLAFIAVYMVFGLTGNSLVYDGVGFLFWLIFSQIIKISITNKSYENSASFGSK